jgi:hypothetical protein
VAVTSGGCSARSSAQRELVTSGLYTTLADSTGHVLVLLDRFKKLRCDLGIV